jgi:glycosyltransferase involved in cell wall biosynthesis
MTIAVNTRFLLPHRLEGFGWYTHEIVRRMVQQHPEDKFIFLFDRPFDPRFVYGPNVTPLVLFPPARHPVLWWLWFEQAVPRALRKHQADVFFSPDSYLSLRSGVPTVMTCHDIVPLHRPEGIPFATRKYYQRYLPKFLRRADHLLTVSEYVRQDIAGLPPAPSEGGGGVSLDKISVVYNGCRDTFKPIQEIEKQAVRHEFAGGQEYFFYTGAIHPRKNIPRLVGAFELFKKRSASPAKLLLAGRLAWQTDEVKAALEQSEHRSDIHLLGYVSEEKLPKLMAAALALTYVSLSEGFGLPMLEAMHTDTPVLAANATCLPEIAGDAALLVDPLSEQAMADGLERLWRDRDFAQKLVQRGRVQRERFSWDVAAEQVYNALRKFAP